MRVLLTLPVGLVLHAGELRAAETASAVLAHPVSTQHSSAWPGFEIRLTPELAALAPASASTNTSVAGSPPQIASHPIAVCMSSAIAPRALATSIGKARDGLIRTVRAAECRYSLPPGLLDSLVLAESSYRARAVSRSGAVGLTQLMPATAGELGVSDRRDVGASIEGGAVYLRRMIDRFSKVRLALAAYNAGPGAVSRAGGVPDNGETPGYVARVVALWQAVGGEKALSATTDLATPTTTTAP